MKNNIEIKAFVLSVIITVAIKEAYNINIISIILGINICSLGIFYYLLNKSEKRKNEELEEKENTIYKKLDMKENIHHKKLEELTEVLEKRIESSNSKIIEQLDLVIKVFEKKLELDKENIKDLHALLKEGIDINLEKKSEVHKTLKSVNTQVEAIESIFNEVKLEIEKGNNTVLNLIEVEKDSLDNLIDCKSSLKYLEEKFDITEDYLRELDDTTKEKRDLIYSLKNDINRNIENLQESNEKIEGSYKKIHQSSISELAKLAAKNEYILNLLLDSYKVIKEIAVEAT